MLPACQQADGGTVCGPAHGQHPGGRRHVVHARTTFASAARICSAVPRWSLVSSPSFASAGYQLFFSFLLHKGSGTCDNTRAHGCTLSWKPVAARWSSTGPSATSQPRRVAETPGWRERRAEGHCWASTAFVSEGQALQRPERHEETARELATERKAREGSSQGLGDKRLWTHRA